MKANIERSFIWFLTSLLLSGLLGIGSISLADGDMWAKKADIPTKRYGFGAATVKGKIYTFGGWGEEGGPLAIVEEYEPLTDKWTRKADMPTARHFIEPSVVAMNGKIYVIGGALHLVNWPNAVDNLPTTEEYDPTTNTWRKRADMPTPMRIKLRCFSGKNLTQRHGDTEKTQGIFLCASSVSLCLRG